MLKVAIVFGGMSTEHDVSVVSGTSIIRNMTKEKYDIVPIYISQDGKWYRYTEEIEKIPAFEVGDKIDQLELIHDVMEYLKTMDCIFPVLHGLYGEDGTIQGLLELLKIPYVGCGVLSSSISMDKVYTKIVFDKAKIKQAKYCYIRKDHDIYRYIHENFEEEVLSIQEITDKVANKLTFPMFVKPSNSGSSVGITKVMTKEKLKEAIQYAATYDKKILVEQGVIGKEVECAVLGNEDVIAACVGEVRSAEEFYSFDSKYKNSASRTLIPAELSKQKTDEIRNLAMKAYKAVDGKGLSRVDFFIQEETDDIYINEINTLPGFTKISMYPKLFEAAGISYCEVIDRLIELAMNQ